MSPRVRLVVPVVGLALLSLGPLVRLGTGPTDVVVSLLLWVPALARRRAPLAGLCASAAVLAAFWVSRGLAPEALLPAGVVLFWLLAVVAEHRPTREVVAGAVVVAALPVTVAVVAITGQPGGQSVVPLTALTVLALVVGRNRRTRTSLLQALQDRADRAERERDARDRVAVADERARIAREVHDVVAHNISVMTALADGAGYAMDAGATGPARQAVGQVASTGREAIAEMHRLLGVLRADGGPASDAPTPGLDQLDRLVEQVRAAGLAVTVTVTGSPSQLPATAQLAVHRLVQEALTNTLTHARDARTARVGLTWTPGSLEVEVRDDGRGTTPPADPDRPSGHGLVGMRERIGAWGGSVEAGPGEHGGWRVHAALPLTPAAIR